MDNITFELSIEQVKKLIELLKKIQDELYEQQILANVNGNNELRNKLLERLMTVQDLLSVFEIEF